MKLKGTFILIAALIISLNSCTSNGNGGKKESKTQKDTILPLGFLTDTLKMESTTIKNGETFSNLMQRLGLGASDAYNLANVSTATLDVRKIRAGNKVDAYYWGDSLNRRLDYVVYENDRIHQTVFKCIDTISVWSVEKKVDTLRKYTDVTIKTSLWNDLLEKDASPLLILELADVFAWTVDFFGLHEGDRFRAFYHEKECEGEVVAVSDIQFAIFSRDGNDLYAIFFDQGDGGNRYWNEKGESMRKAFLKAPLKFTRISSRFTYRRKHPISGVVKPHTAVDYAAPMGTPVLALGDGTVLSAGWGGGGGNTIKIRHSSVYTTGYLHLRNFAKGIKAGARVHQGQVIGYVGSTGASTGPHLDFRVWKNGSPVDPLKLESPSAEPLKKENLPALDSLFTVYSAEMAGISE